MIWLFFVVILGMLCAARTCGQGMTSMSVKGSEACQIYPFSPMLVLRLLPTFLFSSFSSLSRSLKSRRTEVTFVFKKIPAFFVLRDLNEYCSGCWFCFWMRCNQATFLMLGWFQVVKRTKQPLPNNVFKALYFEDWPTYLRLNILNTTRTLRSSSQDMLRVPLDVRHLPSQCYRGFQCATALHQELLRF